MNCIDEVTVLLALFVMVGSCDHEYPAELIFKLVDGLRGDHVIDVCQLVSEGDQHVVHHITFGRSFSHPFVDFIW
jgi:hypothetical protein